MTLIDGDRLADRMHQELCDGIRCVHCTFRADDGGCKVERWLDKAPIAKPTVDKVYLISLIQGAVYDGEACRRLIEMVEPKQGEWICEMTKSQDQARDRWVIERVVLYCSECNGEAGKMTKFCPNCGARMKR